MRKKENCDVGLMSGGRVGCWSLGGIVAENIDPFAGFGPRLPRLQLHFSLYSENIVKSWQV